jgi:dTMP kinase
MTSRPLFLVVEGVDGSGKSTLAAAMAERFRSQGRPVELVRPLAPDRRLLEDVRAVDAALDPGGQDLRAVRDNFLAGYFSYRLAVAAVITILPSLARGVTVIADRYVGSHRVNQGVFGADLGASQELLRRLPRPDVTYLLRVPVAVALQRLSARRDKGVGDNQAFITSAVSRFDDLASRCAWRVLDGTLPAEAVVEAAMRDACPPDRGRE